MPHPAHALPQPATPYLTPPASCEPLAALCARAGGTVTDLPGSAPGRVVYALPAHTTAELREYFAREAVVDYAAERIARLPGGRVFGPGIVLSPDGRVIARDVSLDFGRAAYDHWLLTYRKIRPPQPVAGCTAVIATALGKGYAHWLLEELPRLLALGPDAGGAEKLIAHTSQAFSRAGLALQGWRGGLIAAARYSHQVCEQLVVPGLPGPEGRPTPAVVARLTEFVAPLPGAAASFWGERIYVTREQAQRRRVANEAELWPALERRGFVRVRLEELAWRDQINVFRNARVVVAPHGAGLANLVFCRPGAVVVELFNRAYVNGVFWRLAALKGLDYRPVVGESPEPLAQLTARNRDNLVADVGRVLRATG